ncbi:MAG: biopolymer transporter ExbD [Lentisphaeria bacterium]|nr:biopolymer transporter ExbD [Lentisphaeria bacterium]
MTARIGALGARRYRTRLKGLSGSAGFIALADLFFLLLFFILMASSVVRISGIRVNLPRAHVPQAAGLGKAIVTIAPPAEPGAPCRIYFRDRQMDENQLRNELLTSSPRERVLVIRADQDVPSGVLSEIMAIAESAKMETFIAVSTPEARPEMRFE